MTHLTDKHLTSRGKIYFHSSEEPLKRIIMRMRQEINAIGDNGIRDSLNGLMDVVEERCQEID